jgi:phosphatidylglycerophosphate synthase
MIPVYLLGHSSRRLLGYELSQFAPIAAARAGLPFVDTPPAGGEVIVIDPDAAVSGAGLTALARAARSEGGSPLVVRERMVARIDARLLAEREARTVDALVPRDAVVVPDVRVAPFRTPADRRRAEDVLLRGATKQLLSGDFFGVLHRELTLPLVKPVARANIRPNTITLIGFGLTIGAAIALVQGGYRWMLLGALLQWVSSLLDGVDGKLARLKGLSTPFGHLLDHRLDVVYNWALLLGLAIGLGRTVSPAFVMGFAGVMVTGMVIELAVEAHMRAKLVPREHPEYFGPLVFRTLDEHRRDPVLGFARGAIRWTQRVGLPHIFLVLAIVNALPALFVVAAIATHVAWFIALRVLRYASADQATRAVEHAA